MSTVAKMLKGECAVSDKIMRPGLITDVMDLKVRTIEPALQLSVSPPMSPLDSDEEKYSAASDSGYSVDYEKVQHGGNSSDSENIDRALTTEDSESIGTSIYTSHFSC